MSVISNMDLPGSVSQAAYRAYDLTRGDFKAAIRAALQAMVDCGMAVETTAFRWHFEGTDCTDKFRSIPMLTIRLDNTDESKSPPPTQ